MSFLSRIETERDELRATVSQLLSGWNRMVDDIAELKRQNTNLREGNALAEERAKHWCESFHQMAQERNELQRELDSMTHEVIELKHANASLTSHQQKAVNDLKKCSDLYDKRKAEMWQLEQDLNELSKQNIAYQQQIELLEMALAECVSDKVLKEKSNG